MVNSSNITEEEGRLELSGPGRNEFAGESFALPVPAKECVLT
jgi:hypothetical protein